MAETRRAAVASIRAALPSGNAPAEASALGAPALRFGEHGPADQPRESAVGRGAAPPDANDPASNNRPRGGSPCGRWPPPTPARRPRNRPAPGEPKARRWRGSTRSTHSRRWPTARIGPCRPMYLGPTPAASRKNGSRHLFCCTSTPGVTRTRNPQLRRLLLYPIELPGRRNRSRTAAPLCGQTAPAPIRLVPGPADRIAGVPQRPILHRTGRNQASILPPV